MDKPVLERRRHYYINKQFQRNFILKFCALALVGSIVSGCIIYMMSQATVTTTFENSRLTMKSTADYILPAVFLATAIVIILVGAATVFITLFTSHKIAGPLYRIEKDIDEVTSGNLKVLFHLRNGDEIKPIVARLNAMVESLRHRVADIKEAVNDLDAGSNKEKIKRIKDAVDKLKT
ncbi:MAG: HAMP domain-containing protein [Candidatus Omnitrophota bacterium]|jgi:methyl-accepting chemotaxis protein